VTKGEDRAALVLALWSVGLAYGIRNSYGLFSTFFHHEFQTGLGLASLPLSVAMFTYAFTTPLAGWLADRMGARRVVAVGAALLAFSLVVTGTAKDILTVVFSYGLVFGLASACLGQVPNTVLLLNVSEREKRNSPLFGVISTGIGLGALVLTPLLAWCTHAFGWRQALWFAGGAGLPVLAVLILMTRNQSNELGAKSAVPEPCASVERHYLIRRYDFWLLLLAFTFFSGSIYVAVGALGPFLVSKGVAIHTTGVALALLFVPSLWGGMVFGWIITRFPHVSYNILEATCLLISLGYLLLMIGRVSLAYLASLIIGIAYSGYPVLFPTVLRHIASRSRFGLSWGTITMGGAVGAAAGSVLPGYLHDIFQGYTWGWLAGLLLSAACGLSVMLLQQSCKGR